MRRRSAKKSRHGCKECKRRHVKCDETRPSCANCNVRHIPCSFLSSLPQPRSSAPAGPSPRSPAVCSPPQSAQSDEGVRCPAVPSPSSGCDMLDRSPTPWSYYEPAFTLDSLVPTGQTFKLHHLELLHNFKTGVLGDSVSNAAAAEGYMGMTVREAVQAPYLMDQVLALSAANMSVKRPHQRRFYQEEATHLQTRALVLFNAAQTPEATDSNALAGFVFSTLLSQQVLFDALLIRTDFPALLDKLAAAFRICGGVRIMCGKSWPFIMAQYREQVGINLPDEFIAGSGPETVFSMELSRLESLLVNANLDPSILSPCRTALSYLRDLSHASEHQRFSAFRSTRLIQWAVLVPSEFIRLLEERRPEALVIIAYYALLIHDTKDYYWLSGDAGAFIIRSITKLLGSYWAEWLAWPNEVLDSAEYTEGTQPFSPIDISTRCRVDELS